jgi:hypothetical protein
VIGTAYQKVAILLAAAMAIFQCLLVDVAPKPWLCQTACIAHIALLAVFALDCLNSFDKAMRK